jgi:hypothetical protein
MFDKPLFGLWKNVVNHCARVLEVKDKNFTSPKRGLSKKKSTKLQFFDQK